MSAQKIRGVAPSKQQLYHSDGGFFKCHDNSATIAIERVNDDYCDCQDGSDEPGTSACHNGTFFCQNAGHIPAYVPSSRVNDGTCESICCDGSDEWLGIIQCPNTCKEQAKEHAKLEKERAKIEDAGMKIKRQWIIEAQQLRRNIEEEIKRSEGTLRVSKVNLEDKERALAKLEADAETAVDPLQEQLDANMKKFRDTISSLESKIADQEQRIETLESILRDMAGSYNPNFQDMAVKGAATKFNELEPLPERDIDFELVKSLVEASPQLPPSTVNTEEISIGFWGDLKKIFKKELASYGLIQLHSEESTPANVPRENVQLTNMRATVEKVREDIVTAERTIAELQSSLDQYYGEDDVYRAVKGQCFSALISDYTYEVCLLENLHQKSASSSTLVGNFDRVDENGSILYNHGARCWNGPERSGRVDIECGSTNELLSVREAQKCEYVFRIKSPLACQSSPRARISDEL